jgi:hypothetical protein
MSGLSNCAKGGISFCAAAWFEQLLEHRHHLNHFLKLTPRTYARAWLPTVLRMVRVGVMVLAASLLTSAKAS